MYIRCGWFGEPRWCLLLFVLFSNLDEMDGDKMEQIR